MKIKIKAKRYIVPAQKKVARCGKIDRKKREFGGSLVNKREKKCTCFMAFGAASGVANEADNCYYQMLSDPLQIKRAKKEPFFSFHL